MTKMLGYLDILRGASCALGAALLIGMCFAAHAEAPPGTDHNTPEARWYEGARSETGVNCCSMADGHRAQARYIGTPPNGRYEVLINGEWKPVPPWTYLMKGYPPHPAGSAVVWETHIPSDPIRCFSPPVAAQ